MADGSGSVAVRSRPSGDSRDRLLRAAAAVWSEKGYFEASVDEVAAAAGVSRMTFYRQFDDKAALAIALFRASCEAVMPTLLAVRDRDWRDRAAVAAWIDEIFVLDRSHPRLLRVFLQANTEASGFRRQAQKLLADMIEGLGRTIPAFRIDRSTPIGRRRWLEAWLLLYELLDQSNHAASGAEGSADPLLIEILAHRFLAFSGT